MLMLDRVLSGRCVDADSDSAVADAMLGVRRQSWPAGRDTLILLAGGIFAFFGESDGVSAAAWRLSERRATLRGGVRGPTAGISR
jgi:hypothetical protein